MAEPEQDGINPMRPVHLEDVMLVFDAEDGQTPNTEMYALSLQFQNLSFKIKLRDSSSISWRNPFPRKKNAKAKEKQIVQNLSGTVSSGEMLAVMGPSGSGKTTLLNLLGGRIQNGWTGTITYGGLSYNKQVKKRIGFVTQTDVVYPHLTVKETLIYSAILRLPRELSKDEKIRKANEIISELSLERCQNTIMGGIFLRGISSGERKRVCIGIEMLSHPSIIFLDEPTSGLDSTIALHIIEIAKTLSEKGLTVVIAIHQPSTRIFRLFDKLMLLSEGNCAYMGEAQNALNHFLSLGFSPCSNMNPPEFFLDLCTGNLADIHIPEELIQRMSNLAKISDSKSFHEKTTDMNQVGSAKIQGEEVKEYIRNAYTCEAEVAESHQNTLSSKCNSFRASWYIQFQVLFWRGLKERRHEYLSIHKFVEITALALIAGVLWMRSNHSTDSTLTDQLGLIFFIVMTWGIYPLFQAIFIFPQERAMLSKERGQDMYSLSAYFMARVFADAPLDLILPSIFMAILSPMTHLRGEATFWARLVALYLIVLASQGIGFVVGAAVMDVNKATSLGTIVLTTMLLSGGSFVKNIPKFISWLKYLSYQHYGYNLLLKIEYSPHMAFDCNTKGCSILGNSYELSTYDLNGGFTDALCLFGIIIICRILAYLMLRFRKHELPY